MTERGSILVLMVVVASTVASQASAEIPMNGTFDIVIDPPETDGISFEPIPWVSPSIFETVYLWPFASDDGTYTSPYSEYNLAQVQFNEVSIYTLEDYFEQEGDLGIRINNNSGATQIFDPSVLTLDFVGDSFDIYLPGFTFDWMTDMFFWIAQSGATYYANSSKGVGFPDMSAGDAMAAGDEYLARVPEPATVLVLGLGGLILRKRR